MDKSAPSKESLERAQKWVARKGFQWPESAMEWLALEFDAIRRERDKVPTDLQAALYKACEDAAEDIARDARYSEDMTCPSKSAMKSRMLQHFRLVFEALRDSVIEECKKVVCDISEMYEKKKEGRVRIAESHEWSAFFICLALDELKGAPR